MSTHAMTAEWRPESTGGPSWPALRAITRVRHPRDPEPSQLAQLWRQHVTAAVAAFHAHRATGTPLVFGWLHPDLAGPATIAATSHNGHHGPLLFPASTDSRTLTEPELSTLLAGLPVWTRVGIATSQPADADAEAEALTGGLDAMLASWPAPYGWLVHATPITPEHASELAAHEAEAETKARANALKSARHAQTADQHAGRYREYAAAPTSGLWQLHLLAASIDNASAHAVAGLLSAGFSLHNQSYTLIPTAGSGTLAQIWATSTDDTITGAQSPQTVSTKLLAALATLPRSGLPGIAVEPSHTFSLNVPQHENGLRLGHVIRPGDGKLGQPVTLAPDVLAQHMFVTGTTGSGKTTTIRGLLHHATAAGVPWLVIEPTKTEYRQLATSSDVVVLRPGDPTQPAIGFNPLQPVSGFGLQTHADLTRALFTAAFDAAEPFPQILDAALTAAYEQAGWDLVLSQPSNPDLTPAWPTLTDLHRCALHIIAEAGYGKEIEQNVHGFVNIRLAKLSHGTTGTILNAPRQLDITKLMRRNVILELDNIGDDADKAFLMGALLIQLTGHLRTSPTTAGLRHLTVVEEAHRLLRKPHREGPAAHAVEQFSNLLAEVRAYGEGLIIADQIPTKLINDVLKNTSTKIAHRLPDKEDRDAIAATTNLTASQSQDLISAQPGDAAVHTAGMKEPAYTSITAVTAGSRGTQISTAEIAAELPAGCGPSCHDSPCTVADHRQAQRLLASTPPLRIWADLTVLAHLVGLPAPRPAAHLAASIAQMPETLLRHALGAATTASVRSRLPAISSTHSPGTFAAHIFGDLHSWTSNVHPHDDTTREPEIRLRCTDNPAKWRLEPFRYNGIRHELAEAIHRTPNAPRHPNSSRWETLIGKPIPGATAAEQMTIVAGWSTHLSQRYPHTDTVLFGLDPVVPSVLRISIDDADWPEALDSALESFETGVAWIQAYLAAQPVQGSWR